jgi:signal transduction histidine kinase
VEDELSIREALVELLDAEGYDVHACDNGATALERLRAAVAPDVILLDLRLPVMDGWQFRMEQRRDARLASIPVVAMSADGTPKAMAVHADAYLHKPFHAAELLATLTRIIGDSQRRQLEARLIDAERLAGLGRVAAAVGHEINNPLTYVSLNVRHFVDQMQAAHPDRWSSVLGQPELLVLMRETVDGLERIQKIVGGLLGLARKEDALVPVDVEQLLDSALLMADHQLRPRARLVKQYCGTPGLTGHPGRLTQLFLNLIINAAQAIDEGKRDTNQVTVATAVDEESVRIEISDTGKGVPLDLLPRIFDPFFTTKPLGTGTGLGLAISRQVVADHGGDIDVETSPGRGTTIRIHLPRHLRAAPGVDESTLAPSPSPAMAPIRIAGRARVLVIDDEPLIAKSIQRLLGRDHDVVAVGGVKAACALVSRGERFDALLCDLTMPDGDGPEFHAYLETEAAGLIPRLAFVTGGAVTATTQQFLADHPSTPILHKPFDVAALRELVATLVGRRPTAN